MSLPPYKHTRNPCLQTEDEPVIPGLAGAPLITHRSVQEKRRTSDQRVARIQKMSGLEVEYEYVPPTQTPSESQVGLQSREKMVLKPEIEDHHHHRGPKIKTVNFESVNEQGPRGPSGDQQDTAKDIDRRNDLEDANIDAKSTCSRRSSLSHRSSVSHCSQTSHKTGTSSKSQKLRKRSGSRESLSSTLSSVPKTPNPGKEKSGEMWFQRFGRIANGLDDDDLRPRRR